MKMIYLIIALMSLSVFSAETYLLDDPEEEQEFRQIQQEEEESTYPRRAPSFDSELDEIEREQERPAMNANESSIIEKEKERNYAP